MLKFILLQGLRLIEPYGLIWLSLLVLTVLLWRKRQRRFAAAVGALTLLVTIAGTTGWPGGLLGTLERPYAGLVVADLPKADAVILLGGGASPSRYEAGGFHLTAAGDRLHMAVEVMRLGKAPVLVIGGGAEDVEGQPQSEADLVHRQIAATQPAWESLSLGICSDTHDEALKVRALAQQRGWRRLLLVTSAWHMRRAEATFRTAGLEVTPVPCNFLTNVSTPPPPFRLGVPNSSQFEKFSYWLHEQAGWWEYRRRGWINTKGEGQRAKGERSNAAAPSRDAQLAATFSIVARDPATGELGVAVQSKVVAVGAIVPWAKAGVGAVATQAWANPTYGPRGLDLLAAGKSPEEAVKELTSSDTRRDERQLGILAADGRAATFTGQECLPWASGRSGENYAVQGNILTGPEVVAAMAAAFERSTGPLGERLLTVLEAAQAAGGDRRGKQSAALLIVREGWGYAGLNDRYRDLRVDDHPDPIPELRRIYEIHRAVFPQPSSK